MHKIFKLIVEFLKCFKEPLPYKADFIAYGLALLGVI